jgi:hypothetical protein
MHFLSFIVVLLVAYSSVAQQNKGNVGNEYDFVEVSDNALKIYVNNCKDTALSQIVTQIITKQNSSKARLSCNPKIDSSDLGKICEILASKEKLRHKLCFINSMAYDINTTYYYLIVFKKAKFKKFLRLKKREHISIEDFTGRIKVKNNVPIGKFANEYFLERINNSISIKVINGKDVD